MTWFDVEGINGDHYIIREDKIIYYVYSKEGNFTTVQVENSWMTCKGDITKELRRQMMLLNKSSVIVVKGE